MKLTFPDINKPDPIVNPGTKISSGLNKIHYGPPGTGKTYKTINGALQIIDNDFYIQNKSDRLALKNKFDEYVKNERIGFVTFHQSFSYEDFVEGLRAEADDGNICYFVQDGIFKQLCEKATQTEASNSIDEAIQQLIEKMEEESVRLSTSSGKGFTLTYKGGRTFRVKPDSSDKLSEYPASIENIKKVFRGGNIKDIYNPSYVLSILEYLKSEYGITDHPVTDKPKDPVVLIIDEINRGNTANIFGELITLIGQSKRAGAEDREHTLGHSSFLSLNKSSTIADLRDIFEQQILPLLEEYFFEDWEKI